MTRRTHLGLRSSFNATRTLGGSRTCGAASTIRYTAIVDAKRALSWALAAAAIVGPVAQTPEMSVAEGLLDFFFGGGQKQQQQTSSFGNLFNNNP